MAKVSVEAGQTVHAVLNYMNRPRALRGTVTKVTPSGQFYVQPEDGGQPIRFGNDGREYGATTAWGGGWEICSVATWARQVAAERENNARQTARAHMEAAAKSLARSRPDFAAAIADLERALAELKAHAGTTTEKTGE